jgi:FKBP-type peptidyl-prolyl cis-trans isomerase
MHKLTPAIALALLLGACGEPASLVVADDDAVSAFTTDDERIVYAIGVVLGENVTDFGLTEAETAVLVAGIRDAARASPYQVEMNVYRPQIQTFVDTRTRASREAAMAEQTEALAREKASGAELALQLAAEPRAERSVSGLVFVPITDGSGESPGARDTVTVHYHGTFRDGSVFDSSVERGEPSTFPLTGVIPCWTEGVQKIKVGGKAKLLCPSEIAYGDEGRPGIPGGAALLFEVELIAIE